ncbi:glutaminase domain-containing protein, partial [Bacteroides sp.]
TFQKFSDPVYKYINETVSRVPISDWHHTDSGKWVGFRARSVIGGYWMRV